MISAILVIIGLSVLVLIHELGHFLAAKRAGLLVEEFGFGFPPRMFSIKKGETRYSFNWLPFGGFVKIYGEKGEVLGPNQQATESKVDTKRSFAHQSFWTRMVIIGAGISINFIFGWLLLSLVFMVGARQAVIVSQIAPGSPAELAQIEAGDELVGFKTVSEFTSFTNAHRGEAVEMKIKTQDVERAITITPRVEVPVGQGALGVAIIETGFAKYSFFGALWHGLAVAVESMAEIFKAFGALVADIFGHGRVPENVVGPIGIFGVAGQLGDLGFVYVLQLIAMISLNLAVLNFIPFPALDGGRLLFLIIEKIKGSPIHAKGEIWANGLSFIFLILLMMIITGRDIIRLF
jgi:regulator of sigma E protease